MNVFAQLFKVDEQQRLVYGRAVQETPDRSDEVFDYATSKSHFADWSTSVQKDSNGKSLGNVRAMHGKVAAGKLQDIQFNDADKAIDVTAKIVDDTEWNKVLEGVYTGFSIGGSYVKKWQDPANKELTRYTAAPTELSLVDRPCIPTCNFFDVKKADGTLQKVEFVKMFGKDEEDKKEMPAKDEKSEDSAEEKKKKKDAGVDKDKMPMKDGEKKEAKDEKKADDDAEEETEKMDTVYEVTGTPEDVQKLADVMGINKMTVVDVVSITEKHLEAVKSAGIVGDILAKEESGELKKGMYSVSRLASLLADADSLCQGVCREQGTEGGYKSTLPTTMKSVVSAMVAALRQMVVEETADMLGERDVKASPEVLMMAEAIEGLSKVGSRNNAQDQKRIDEICRLAVELGARYEMKEAADDTGDLAKIEAPADMGALEKMVADSVAKALEPIMLEKAALEKKVAELLARPAAPRGVLKAVTKGTDVVETEVNKVEPVVDHTGKENDAASLIKALHKSGGVPLQTQMTSFPSSTLTK
jgi:hypothetical protein